MPEQTYWNHISLSETIPITIALDTHEALKCVQRIVNEFSFLCLLKLHVMRSVSLLWNWFAEEWELQESSQILKMWLLFTTLCTFLLKKLETFWRVLILAYCYMIYYTRTRIISLASLWTRNDIPFSFYSTCAFQSDLQFLSLFGNNTFPCGKGSAESPQISTLFSILHALCSDAPQVDSTS